MRIIFMQGNIVHWITPYESLEDVPEHPSSDIYIEAPDEVQEGWVYDGEKFYEPEPELELENKMSSDQAQRLLTAKATLGLTLSIETEVEAQVALLEGLPLPEPSEEAEWQVGERVVPGVVRTYQGKNYECIQGHVTQVGWEPGSEGGRTLFRILRDEPGEGEDPLDFVWGELVPYGAIRRDPINGKHYTPIKETGVILYEPHYPHMVPSEYQEVSMSGNGGNEDEILPWTAGVDVVVGDKRTYGGKTYSCLQAHKTQASWTPPNAPSLWKEATV